MRVTWAGCIRNCPAISAIEFIGREANLLKEEKSVPGQINRMLNQIIEKRSKGNETIISITKTKLILKGINPDKFNTLSPDDPEVITRIRTIAVELGVSL